MAAGRAHPTTQLYQLYAEPFDLPTMKLLILHVSEHRDENIVRPIWNKTFEDSQFVYRLIIFFLNSRLF